MKIKVLYFASLGDKLGKPEEVLELSENTIDLNSLKQRIVEKTPGADILLDEKTTRAAINQTIINENCPINDGDEVAFFPPVTGG